MNTFCTIITHSHLPYVFTLYKSIAKHNPSIVFNVFISDRNDIDNITQTKCIKFYGCHSLCSDGYGKKIKSKYQKEYMDEFRWSMKPVFINYLLERDGYNKVIYVDSDIYFFDDYEFLFNELDKYDVLLTPHWRGADPNIKPKNFNLAFTEGIYNAGFVAANQNGRDALNWWSMACEYACEKNRERALYVDQRYLNLLPVYFNNIGIVKHRGCNVALWNRDDCIRVLKNDGSILIDGKYPIVFIHFTQKSIQGIVRGDDPLLMPYLQEYATALQNEIPGHNIITYASSIIAKQNTRRKGMLSIIKNQIKKYIAIVNDKSY
jgi:hypothetical protein